jgi:hypothetical protein
MSDYTPQPIRYTTSLVEPVFVYIADSWSIRFKISYAASAFRLVFSIPVGDELLVHYIALVGSF